MHAADDARRGAFSFVCAPLYRLPELTAKRFCDRPALDFFGKKTTYGMLAADICRYAAALAHIGAKKGDRIILATPNCPPAVAFYYAILRVGGTVVNLNPASAPHEAARILALSEAKFAATVNIRRVTDMLGEACALAGDACRIQKILTEDFTERLPFGKKYAFRILKSGELIPPHLCQGTFFAMRHVPRRAPVPPSASIDPRRDVAALQYTGGTTGACKGAMLTHANLYANAAQSAQRMDFLKEGGETVAAVLPFFHVFAMTAILNTGVYKGLCIKLYPLPNVESLCKDARAGKITVLPGVPNLFAKMAQYCAARHVDLSSLVCAVSGGAPLSGAVKEEFERFTGAYVMEGYGLTEASPVVALHPYRPAGGDRPGSSGLPLPGTEIRICALSEGGGVASDLRVGETGEICVRGPQVMAGYDKSDACDESNALGPDGWLRTGDLGYLDRDGYLYVVGRRKELIIVSGFNVYPREIEELLCVRDDVAEAAAVGVSCSRTGQAVMLFVSPAPGKNPTESDIFAYVEERLSRYKLPRRIVFLKELPKTPLGKPDKKRLCAELEEIKSK
ncbi:MAG: AMP-binding protein [Rickettsiales bacterium]